MSQTYPCPHSVTPKEYELMLALHRDLMADLSKPMPTTEFLARSVYMSPSKFRTMFIKIFGASIYQFHLNARIKLAMELLNNSNCTIEQIAYKVGFSRSQSFAKAFLAHVGQTATQYRNASLSIQK